MPLVIGNVTSQEVYNSRLKYKRKIPAKTCCRFIDVTNGREERQGKSWIVNCIYEITSHLFFHNKPL